MTRHAIDALASAARRGRVAGVAVYDYTTARLCQAADVDLLLVGDSIGPVSLGIDAEEVTLETMVVHARAVRAGAGPLPVVVDLPLGESHDATSAVGASRRLLDEDVADLVKVEVEPTQVGLLEVLAGEGVPFLAHVTATWACWSDGATDVPTYVEKLGDLGVEGVVLVHAAAETVIAVMERAEKQGLLVIGHDAPGPTNGTIVLLSQLTGFDPLYLPRGGPLAEGLPGSAAAALAALQRFEGECHEAR